MSTRSSMSKTRRKSRNSSVPIRRVSTLKDASKEVEAGAGRRSSSCDLPVRRGTLPLPSDLDIMSYQWALRDKGKEEESRWMCPCFKRRIFASCISTYAKKVILKTWLIRVIFAFAMGMTGGMGNTIQPMGAWQAPKALLSAKPKSCKLMNLMQHE